MSGGSLDYGAPYSAPSGAYPSCSLGTITVTATATLTNVFTTTLAFTKTTNQTVSFTETVTSTLTLPTTVTSTLTAVSTVTSPAPTAPGPPPRRCTVGSMQCCNSLQKAVAPAMIAALAVYGKITDDDTGYVGVTCKPLVVGNNSCATPAQAVCCTNSGGQSDRFEADSDVRF